MVVIRFRPNAKLDPMRLVKVVGGWPGAVLVPPPVCSLIRSIADLRTARSPATEPAPARKSRRGSQRPADTSGSCGPRARRPARCVRDSRRRRFSGDREADPRAEGGMFSRLAGLLQAIGGDGQSF